MLGILWPNKRSMFLNPPIFLFGYFNLVPFFCAFYRQLNLTCSLYETISVAVSF